MIIHAFYVADECAFFVDQRQNQELLWPGGVNGYCGLVSVKIFGSNFWPYYFDLWNLVIGRKRVFESYYRNCVPTIGTIGWF